MTRIILLFVLFSSNIARCQVDPAKKDSLVRVIELKQKSLRSSQDSFIRMQESVYHAAAATLQDSINHSTSRLAEKKQIARSNERQIYVLIGTTALLLVLLVLGLLRLRKKSKQP